MIFQILTQRLYLFYIQHIVIAIAIKIRSRPIGHLHFLHPCVVAENAVDLATYTDKRKVKP